METDNVGAPFGLTSNQPSVPTKVSRATWAGLAISLFAMVVVGIFVTNLIEDAVTRNSAATTALYVDSVIAPLLPDMQTTQVLDDVVARALDETLGQGALGARLMSFRLWRGDGTILYSNDKEMVGKRFTVSRNLKKAFAGTMVAKFNRLDDSEDTKERASGQRNRTGHGDATTDAQAPVQNNSSSSASSAAGTATYDTWVQDVSAITDTAQSYIAQRTAATSAAQQSIDQTMATLQLDAIAAPTNSPAWVTTLGQGDAFVFGSSGPAAVAGYPNVSVPMGFVGPLPVGVSLFAGRWDEPKLISFAYAYEQATHVRRAPQFLPTLPSTTVRSTAAPAALTRAPARVW